MELTRHENDFIAETIEKELFFALTEGEPTPLTQMVASFIEWELEKLQNRSIGSADYPGDIATAKSTLAKLKGEAK